MKNKKFLFLIAVLLVLSVLSYIVVKWGLASAGHDIAMSHISNWEKNQKIPSLSMWEEADRTLKSSVLLDDENADFYNDKGRFYEFSSRLKIDGLPSEEELLDEAAESFRHSISTRPEWAVPWANLLLVKFRQGKLDDEFRQALNKSSALGASVMEVQKVIVEVGITHWKSLREKERQSVLHATHFALNGRNKHFVEQMMDKYHLKPYFCLKLSKEDKTKICQE